jgi:O-succinylbenzoic acid--CoA ligase
MIFIHPYALFRKKSANSQTPDLVQKGCLIKIEDISGGFGVADLCPWPTLGDMTLDEELLKKGPLFQRALELAQKDLNSRKNKQSLISDIKIKNHILVSDYKKFDFNLPEGSVVKIKGDTNFIDLARILNSMNSVNPLRIRLDFNFCLNEQQFRNFIDLLSDQTVNQIEVVEDPFEFNQKPWDELNQKVTLALDWNSKNQLWKNRICKPSRQMLDTFLYMTSAMDHPVGVAHGVSIAQQYPELTHGFLTNDLYLDCGFEESTGFGIGYERQLSQIHWQPLIDWSADSENHFLVNTKLQAEEKNILFQLFDSFNEQIANKNYFLIPSSGSSRSVNESIKLIALKKTAVLNSANRVNQQFNLTDQMNWGCVLPTFHVAGLGILARAHLSGAKVIFSDWKNLISKNLRDWIIENKIGIISLVPAQIYDLIQKNIYAPPDLKIVFVGGSELSRPLAKKAFDLGWPMIQTYGMTETASMVAFKSNFEDENFELMKGILIQESTLQCDSQASYSIQRIDGEIQIKEYPGGIPLSDEIQVEGKKIKFMGRTDDKVQILSETVSLSELRSKLEKILIDENLLITDFALKVQPNERSENQVVLFSTQSSAEIIQKFNDSVRPYEKIGTSFIVQVIPKTELGKIKYNELSLNSKPD